VTYMRLELSRPVTRVPPNSLREPPASPAGTFPWLVLLALPIVLVPAHRLWAAQVLLAALVLTVPGVLLLRALRVPGSTVASFPVYVPCASIVVLYGTGLGVNMTGPVIGIAEPLRLWPMLAGLELVCLILLAISANAPPDVAIPWRDLALTRRTALPLVLPLVAAAGALRLNTGHSNGIALIAQCGCVIMTVALFAYASRVSISLLAVGLYAVGLAMMWSFSLRGASVYGSDISNEYYVLQHVSAAGVWHPSSPDNAYAAMLSTTILPSALHAITGVSDLMIFKLVYPMLSVLFPVAVFYIGRRILSSRWAFAAGALIITQSGFGQELPAIARQEIALVCFTALMAAALETNLPLRRQLPVTILFGLAMVVSHYTTTYVTVTILGLTLVLQWLQWLTYLMRPTRVSAGMITALLVSALGAVFWYGPVTHSFSNAAQLAEATQSQGLDLLPNRSQAGGLIAAYLDGNTVTPITPQQYEQEVHAEYEKYKPFVHPLPDAGNRAYALRASTTPTPPVNLPTVYNAFSLANVLAQQLIYLLSAVGAMMLVFGRAVPAVARQVGLLTAATLVFLLVIRFSGTLATFYNAERALLQAMAFLDISMFWCMQVLAERRRLRLSSAVSVAAAALIVVIFAASNGLVGAILGGGTASNLANSGYDYEQFYVNAEELASAAWLGGQVRPGELVYTDDYGQLPLVTVTGIRSGLLLDVTPETLSNHAWVYASRTNVIDGQAHSSFNDHSVVYVYPANFLNSNYNLVYTNGSSEVYHR
jgi:uncharacterized membrane protein